FGADHTFEFSESSLEPVLDCGLAFPRRFFIYLKHRIICEQSRGGRSLPGINRRRQPPESDRAQIGWEKHHWLRDQIAAGRARSWAQFILRIEHQSGAT